MTPTAPDCLINGRPTTAVDASDRGLAYGDGVFETIAVVNRQPRLFTEHCDRLDRGCERLGFTAPTMDDWQADLDALDLPRRGVLRVTVTRGIGGQGYAPPALTRPTRITRILPAPDRPAEWWQTGVDVRWCDMRLAAQPALAGIKHLNRLEQILARREWNHPDIAEGLMRTIDGRVIEATASNLIVDDGDRLLVPDTRDCGVDGIMQQWLIGCARADGFAVERTSLQAEALLASHGVMLTNSLIGLWPVKRIGGTALTCSPWARWLQERIASEQLALTPGLDRP